MANKNLSGIIKRPGKAATPQSRKAAKGQKRNSAGGFTFKVTDMDRAKRFLILGSDTSFYESGATLTRDNAKTLIQLAESVQGA